MKYELPITSENLSKAIRKRFAPIIRMFAFTKNNATTKSSNRKTKLMQRSAYGYKNF